MFFQMVIYIYSKCFFSIQHFKQNGYGIFLVERLKLWGRKNAFFYTAFFIPQSVKELFILIKTQYIIYYNSIL